jgi:hypothetical protein
MEQSGRFFLVYLDIGPERLGNHWFFDQVQGSGYYVAIVVYWLRDVFMMANRRSLNVVAFRTGR